MTIMKSKIVKIGHLNSEGYLTDFVFDGEGVGIGVDGTKFGGYSLKELCELINENPNCCIGIINSIFANFEIGCCLR